MSPGVIVVNKGDDSISSFADLKGKTTAQSLTSNWYELAKKSGADVENVEGWAQAVTLLKQGRVDATINDELTYLDYENTEGDTGLAIAADHRRRGPQRGRLPPGQRLPGQGRRQGAGDPAQGRHAGQDLGEVLRRRRLAVNGMDWELIRSSLGPLVRGALLGTIPLALASFALGLALALVVALMRLSRVRAVSAVARPPTSR